MSSNIFVERICQFCEKSFTARTTVTKYCSHRCASRAYKARKRNQSIELSRDETFQKSVVRINQVQMKDYLSVEEASELLGISRWTLTRAIQDKRLNAVRFGKRIVIKRTDVDKLFICEMESDI